MNKKVVFLPYDMDTAIGINNEGALVFGYNLEDTDQVGGADVFNGQNSVLWCNLRDTYGAELKALYQQLRSSGALSYEKVEKQFEDHQDKWSEAIFNEDAFYKYIKPLIDDDDESYLSMLQGSKAEQRKWWLYNRFKYLDSKYNAGDSQTDYIQLRGYAKDNITITPYADIYVTIRWASYLRQQRGVRNTAYTMICPLDNVNDSEIYIYSASQLSSIGDISGLKIGFADFHNATKIQELILGSPAQGYTNPNLRSINVGNLKLLKKIDARNCVGLGTYADQKSIDLSGCSGIEEVYFEGTSILGVELPNGGFMKKLHLPGTITNLTIRNQTSINDFSCSDYSNISTLFLENSLSLSDIDTIMDDVTVGCRIRLFNYYWNFDSIADVNTFLAKFNGMTGMDQNGDNTDRPQIFATVHVPTATGDQIDAIQTAFPDITVEADTADFYLKYYDKSGTTLLYTETVGKNQNGTWAAQPAEDDAQYTYTFIGWSLMRNSSQADANALNNLTGNRNVYAAYSRVVKTYTITFVRAEEDGGGTLQSSQVAYGQTPSYTGEPPTTTKEGDYSFKGWTPAIMSVTGNQTYTAAFIDNNSITYNFIKRTISSVFDDEVEVIGPYAFTFCSNLTAVSFPAVTRIGASAFQSCRSLATVSFPSVTSIESSAFQDCRSLTTVSFPAVTNIGSHAFWGCRNLTTVSFPAVTNISGYAFWSCSNLTTVSFPAVTSIGGYAFRDCGSLTTASFPVATSIGDDAFYGCSNLTTVSFPAVTSIGSYAFQDCHNLVTVSFPAVTNICSYAFRDCSNLTVFVLQNSSVVASMSSTNAFGNADSAIFYVADNLVSAYQSANNWSYFSSRIKGISELPE